MKNRYFIRHKVASLYIVLYILALVTLIVAGLIPAQKGTSSSVVVIASAAVMVLIFTLVIKEAKKGLFDIIILEEEFIVLSRFGKKAYLSWRKVEFIDIKTYKKVGGDKFIIITFMKNSAGSDLELKLDFRQDLYDKLIAHHGRAMGTVGK